MAYNPVWWGSCNHSPKQETYSSMAQHLSDPRCESKSYRPDVVSKTNTFIEPDSIPYPYPLDPEL